MLGWFFFKYSWFSLYIFNLNAVRTCDGWNLRLRRVLEVTDWGDKPSLPSSPSPEKVWKMALGVIFPLLSVWNGADTFPGLLLIAAFPTTDKSQMLMGVSGHFVQWEKAFLQFLFLSPCICFPVYYRSGGGLSNRCAWFENLRHCTEVSMSLCVQVLYDNMYFIANPLISYVVSSNLFNPSTYHLSKHEYKYEY